MRELDRKESSVVLPMSDKQFKDFIQSLLWKPQTISKDFIWYYSIDKDDVINLNKLLCQRISQQNKSRLVNFSVSIYYNDNSTVELNWIEHLIDYIETLPLICEALHLTWKFLVQFEDKDSPELQEVNISFFTETPIPKKYEFQEDIYNWFFYGGRSVNLRIKHTARTWWADIEWLISRHIEKIIKKESKFINFFGIRYWDDDSILITLIMFSSSLFILLNLWLSWNIDINRWLKWMFFIIILYYLLKIIAYIWERFLRSSLSKDSYILLNKESIKFKDIKEKEYKNSWLKLILYVFFQIIIGIVWNFLYSNFF